MASVVAGGLFNAVAFACAGFLFSKLNHRGYEDEIKRHNLEHIAQLRQELADSNHDFNVTNEALIQLKKYEETINPEPKLSDYYKPSREMKHRKFIDWFSWTCLWCRSCRNSFRLKTT